MGYLDILIIVFGISYSFLIVRLIDNGMQIKLHFYFLIVAFAISIAYGLFIEKSSFENLNWGFLTLPVFIVVLYNLVNLISWRINKREFRLSIRGSRNLYKENTNWLDKVFSFFVVISMFVWPVLIALFLKNKL